MASERQLIREFKEIGREEFGLNGSELRAYVEQRLKERGRAEAERERERAEAERERERAEAERERERENGLKPKEKEKGLKPKEKEN